MALPLKSIALLLFCSQFGHFAAFADISPTVYSSYNIAPAANVNIRMVKAKVDIDWGEPCSLKAVFEMDNRDSVSREVEVGFPQVVTQGAKELTKLGFTIMFDGVQEPPSEITQVASTTDPLMIAFVTEIWFRCRHVFPPGKTLVTVKTTFPPSLVYHTSYREGIYYRIQTGGFWADTIGQEEVKVHFPTPILVGQIMGAIPGNITISGNTVSWVFNDFKPHDNDHDIYLEYYTPGIIEKLNRARKLAADPKNRIARLQLAVCLSNLYGGYAPYPPSFVPGKYFKELCDEIEKAQDRELIYSKYVAMDDGFLLKDFDFGLDKERILDITRDWNPNFLEAEDLVRELIQQNPKDPNPWIICSEIHYFSYLPNHDPSTNLKEALKNCPEDEGLLILKELEDLRSSRYAGQRSEDLQNKLEQILTDRGIQLRPFPSIKYNHS